MQIILLLVGILLFLGVVAIAQTETITGEIARTILMVIGWCVILLLTSIAVIGVYYAIKI